jgi:hypothetical protein
MSTPDLHLRICLPLDDAGRIVSTREPEAPCDIQRLAGVNR